MSSGGNSFGSDKRTFNVGRAEERFDMREAIRKVVQAMTPEAEKKGLALVAEVAPEVGEITSD